MVNLRKILILVTCMIALPVFGQDPFDPIENGDTLKEPKKDVSKKNPYGPAFPEFKPLVVDDYLTGAEKIQAECKVRKLIIDKLSLKCKMLTTKRIKKKTRGYLVDGGRVIAVGTIVKRTSKKRSRYLFKIVEESPNIIDFKQSGYKVVFIDKKATEKEYEIYNPNKVYVNPLISLDIMGGNSNTYLQNLVVGEQLSPKTSLTGYSGELFLPYLDETAFFNWIGYKTTHLSGESNTYSIEYEDGSTANNFDGKTTVTETSNAIKVQPHISPNQPLALAVSYILSQKEKADVELTYPEQNLSQKVELVSSVKGIELEASAKLFGISNMGFGLMLPSDGTISAKDPGKDAKEFQLGYQHFWLQGGVEQKFGASENFHYRILLKYQSSTYTVSGEEQNTKEYKKDNLSLGLGVGFSL